MGTGKSRISRSILAILAAAAPLLSTAALADATTGFYVGAGIGNSNIKQDFSGEAGSVYAPASNRFGWKLIVGFRPMTYFGAQLEYMDYGEAHLGPNLVALNGVPGGPFGLYGSRSYAKAGGAFAIGYLPILPQWLDIYGKLGIAELRTAQHYSQNESNTYTPQGPLGIVSVAKSSSEAAFGYGAGIQTHLGPFTVQAEYERLSSSAADPSLLTLNLSWTF